MENGNPNERISHENNNAEAIETWADSQEALHDATLRRDYFEQLDDDDFLALLGQFASMVRTGDSTHVQHLDGANVSLMGHDVPDQLEKEYLLREIWHTTQKILKDRDLDDHAALLRAGLTIGGGILLTHPFIDGNGRTSRSLSYIVANGTEKKDELHDILAKTNGGGQWSIAPASELIPRRKVEYQSLLQPKRIEWEDHFVGEGEDAYGGEIINNSTSDTILRQFIEAADDEAQALIRQAETQDEDGILLDGNKLLQLLADSPQGMLYGKELKVYKRKNRAEKVLRYLDGMESSQPYQLVRAVDSRVNRTQFVGNEALYRARVGKELLERVNKKDTFTIAEQHTMLHRYASGVYSDGAEKKKTA